MKLFQAAEQTTSDMKIIARLMKTLIIYEKEQKNMEKIGCADVVSSFPVSLFPYHPVDERRVTRKIHIFTIRFTLHNVIIIFQRNR